MSVFVCLSYRVVMACLVGMALEAQRDVQGRRAELRPPLQGSEERKGTG